MLAVILKYLHARVSNRLNMRFRQPTSMDRVAARSPPGTKVRHARQALAIWLTKHANHKSVCVRGILRQGCQNQIASGLSLVNTSLQYGDGRAC